MYVPRTYQCVPQKERIGNMASMGKSGKRPHLAGGRRKRRRKHESVKFRFWPASGSGIRGFINVPKGYVSAGDVGSRTFDFCKVGGRHRPHYDYYTTLKTALQQLTVPLICLMLLDFLPAIF